MKKLLFLLVLLASVSMLKAQDKIITTEGDSINCTILSVGSERISYEQKTAKGYAVGKSIEIGQVTEYIRSSQPISTPFEETESNRKWKYMPEHRWMFGISSGISHMPLLLDNMEGLEMPDFYNKAKTGFHFNANAHYMIFSFWGAGIQYSFFNSGYEGDVQTLSYLDIPIYVNSSEKCRQYINYIGGSFIFQQYLDKERKIRISETISGGGLFYRQEEQGTMLLPSTPEYKQSAYNALTKGFTWAGKLGISVEYKVLPYLSVGLGSDVFLGWLSKISGEAKGSDGYHLLIEEQELEQSIDLFRIDGSLALRFHF